MYVNVAMAAADCGGLRWCVIAVKHHFVVRRGANEAKMLIK